MKKPGMNICDSITCLTLISYTFAWLGMLCLLFPY